MESVAENTGPEAAVRPPARKPGSVPSTAERPLAEPKAMPQQKPAPEQAAAQEQEQAAAQEQEQAPEPEPMRPASVAPAAVPSTAATTPRPAPVPATRPIAPPEPERRYRQTIHRVDLWSVLKIAVCFYICGMAVTMVALVALWLIADAAGVIHSVEKFMGDLLQTKNFTFLDGDILRGTLLVAAVLVVLQIVITVIAAAFYNVFAELFGGVEITISEDESGL